MRRLRLLGLHPWFIAVLVISFIITTGFCFTYQGVGYCVDSQGKCQEQGKTSGTGGGGGGGGPVPTPTGGPTVEDIYMEFLGSYSYTFDSPDCTGDDEIKDPVTIVATLNPGYDPPGGHDAEAHLAHHGLYAYENGGQDFREETQADECIEGEISRAEVGGGDRWHARGHEHEGGEIHPYRSGWDITAMTPHRDICFGCGGWPGSCHAVPENYNFGGAMMSGFSAGREYIRQEWEDGHHHYVVEEQIWDNLTEILQECGGQGWTPGSDGIVYFLGITDE